MADLSGYESPLERAKRLTQERVDAGVLRPWVMGDYAARDRLLAAEDRRAAFFVVRGGKRGRGQLGEGDL